MQEILAVNAVVISVLAILAGALFLFFFRYVWRFVFRGGVRLFVVLGRILGPLARAVRAVFRFLGLISKRRGHRPLDAVLSVGVGSLTNALSDIERELAEGEGVEPAKRSRDLLFYSARPTDPQFENYNNDKALRDFQRTQSFFRSDFATLVNPINLYDDINGGIIVRALNVSDKECLQRLYELRSMITKNAYRLFLFLSTLVSLLIALNATASQSVDFHGWLGLAGNETANSVLGWFAKPGHEAAFVNAVLFALASTVGTFAVMLFVNKSYDQKQEVNGQSLDHFLSQYLTGVSNRFNNIKGQVRDAISSEDGAGELEAPEIVSVEPDGAEHRSKAARSLVWIENLHWMAFRVYLIQQFFRIMVFQMRRNIIFAAFFIPAFFVILGLVVNSMLGVDFIWEGVGETLAPVFLIAFLVLLVFWVYGRIVSAYDPVDLEVRETWEYFKQLNVVSSMNEVMLFYENQLKIARERFRTGQG